MGGTQWQKTDIGLQMAAEVYVKMDNISRYKHKIKELIENIRSKTSIKKVSCYTCIQTWAFDVQHDACARARNCEVGKSRAQFLKARSSSI